MRRDDTILSELTQTCDRLRVAIGRIARRIKQRYEAGETTFSEASVLSRLDRAGPATPGALAAAEHVRPQAIVAIVNALAARGLVARHRDPTDGRKVLVELTDAGRSTVQDKGQAVTREMATALMTGFSATEQQRLAAALPLLERLADML